jgi:hypothetical protein
LQVYSGTQSGQYTFTKDAGNQTTVTGGNLTDCTNYYLAVAAYNGCGESEAYSSEVFGWARPALTDWAPTVMQGKQLTVDQRAVAMVFTSCRPR